MALHKIFIHKRKPSSRGFTLMEILVVLVVVGTIASFSLFVDIRNYHSDAFRAERTTLITLLQTARANALNNVGEMPHGVAIFPNDHPNSYVLFDGADYATSNNSTHQIIDAGYHVVFDVDSPTQIIFCQLSGDIVTSIQESTRCDDAVNRYDGKIVLIDTERGLPFDITLNHEGGISW